MKTKFTIIVLVAAATILASGLVAISVQNAAALSVNTGSSSVDVSAGRVTLHAGSDGVRVDIGNEATR
jgi:hypothetical protein